MNWNIHTAPPDDKVGSLHHIVPKCILDRFAHNGQLVVRDRGGRPGPRMTAKVGVRDFYTFVNARSGDEDGRIEQALAHIEGAGISALRTLDNDADLAELNHRELRVNLAALVAVQCVRGRAQRRITEMRTNLLTRTKRTPVPAPGRRLTREQYARRADLMAVEFVSSPALFWPDGYQSTPLPGPPRRARTRRRYGRIVVRPRPGYQVHLHTARSPIAEAEEAVMTVGRRTALAFGAPGQTGVHRMPSTRRPAASSPTS